MVPRQVLELLVPVGVQAQENRQPAVGEGGKAGKSVWGDPSGIFGGCFRECLSPGQQWWHIQAVVAMSPRSQQGEGTLQHTLTQSQGFFKRGKKNLTSHSTFLSFLCCHSSQLPALWAEGDASRNFMVCGGQEHPPLASSLTHSLHKGGFHGHPGLRGCV